MIKNPTPAYLEMMIPGYQLNAMLLGASGEVQVVSRVGRLTEGMGCSQRGAARAVAGLAAWRSEGWDQYEGGGSRWRCLKRLGVDRCLRTKGLIVPLGTGNESLLEQLGFVWEAFDRYPGRGGMARSDLE